MKIEYKLTEKDMLAYYLHFSDNSRSRNVQKRIRRTLVPVLYLIFGWVFFAIGIITITIFFFVAAALWYLFWPIYHRWREKKIYKKHIAETVGGSIKDPLVTETNQEHLFIKSNLAKSKYKYSQVGKIAADKKYTYIYLGKDSAVILPHNTIGKDTVDAFVSDVEKRL